MLLNCGVGEKTLESLLYCKEIQPVHSQDTACLGLVHGDDPQRCYGEGGGRGDSYLGTHVRIKDFKIKKIKKI